VDMLVSPQHRVLITGARAEMLFGEHEVLVAAKHLLGQPGVTRGKMAGVTYLHLLFERHEIVRSAGAWTESFQPADRTLGAMDADSRAELAAIFPELDVKTGFPVARRALKAHEAKVLLAA
jgi:Hint domain